MAHNYFDTFIAVAEDTKATAAIVPELRGGKKTVALMQFEMLSDSFAYTQEEVLFDVWLARQGDAGTLDLDSISDDERASIRETFFAKGQACLRASPLTKAYGWGVIFDEEGRAALCAMESAEYAAHSANPDLTVTRAMRSKRA